MFSRIIRNVEAFFLRPAGSKPLAMFRIVFGAFACIEFLSLRANWLDLLGNEGVVEWIVSKELFAVEGVPHIYDLAALLKPWGVHEDQTVFLVAYSYLFALLALTFGCRTRIAAFSAWLLHVTIWNTGALHGYGVESFTRVALFYCIFMPVSVWWSLDARPDRRACESDSWAAALSYRVLQLHLCIVYLMSGIAKVQGEQWHNGEAMWRVLSQPEYAQFDMFWTADFPWLLQLLGWSTLFVELGYAVLIWPPRTRPFMLCAIVGMHVGIAVLMGLWGFGAVMIILNLAAFGHDTDFRLLLFRRPVLWSTDLRAVGF